MWVSLLKEELTVIVHDRWYLNAGLTVYLIIMKTVNVSIYRKYKDSYTCGSMYTYYAKRADVYDLLKYRSVYGE